METKPLVGDTLLDEQETQTEQPSVLANNDITKEVFVTRTPLMFSRVFANSFQKKGTMTLEVKQQLHTLAVYSGIKINSSLNDSMFEQEDFEEATEPRKYNSTETRVGWIIIPVNTPEEKIMEKFNQYKDTGVIFKILSNSPVFDENQLDAIERQLKTYEEMADKQAVRYGALDPNGKAGQLILDKKGNAQYKRTGFSRTPRPDEDLRYGKSEIYQTPKIKAEMEGAGSLLGQSV